MISFLRGEAEFRDDVIVSFCHHVLVFSSEAAGREWTATRPDALLLTLDQGAEVGRVVIRSKLGQVLDDAREVA